MYKRQVEDVNEAAHRVDRMLTQLRSAGVLCSLAGLAFGPVSYTHLRAHETVLDLVCRLLLEKKKNKIQQKHIIEPSTQNTTYKMHTKTKTLPNIYVI